MYMTDTCMYKVQMSVFSNYDPREISQSDFAMLYFNSRLESTAISTLYLLCQHNKIS